MSWQRVIHCVSMAVISAGFAARPARADFDVRPINVGGKIYTGGVDDGTDEVHAFQSVFTYAFQEEVDDPFNIGDPGFNAPAGSGLQSVAMQFDILGPAQGSRLPYNLSYWDGTGDVEWTIVPDGEALKLILGSQSRTAAAGTSLITGFTLQTVEANGSMHKHLGSSLLGSDGNSVPAADGSWGDGDGIEATPGIYALALQLRNGTLTNSDPFWIIYDNGAGEGALAAAVASVPEPASVALLAIGGCAVGLVVRHRKRRTIRG